MLRRRHVFLLLLAICAACAAPGAPAEQRFSASPHVLREPFLAAWREAGGERLGPPRSAPLWLDSRLIQLFDTVRMEAGAISGVAVQPQPAAWREALPADLLRLEATAYRADLALAPVAGQPAAPGARRVEPLLPLDLDLRIAGYSGPAELRLYDARLRPAGSATADVRDGAARLTLLPRGALGPQWAIILVNGRIAGARSSLFTLDATTAVQSGIADLDALYPRVRGFMEQAVTTYELEGRTIRGYRSPDNPLLWLRDHVYQGRGFRYFEDDVTSLLDAFRRAQRPDGSFPDVIDYPERFVQAFRKEVEADLEFLFVQGVYEAWEMTGDDDWLRANLDAMRRGLRYITSDPLRWDGERGLVKRPYTIDMWDFSYGPTTTSPDGKLAPRHWIDEQTVWGIFHGDNTGLAYAMELMARAEERVGDPNAAPAWRDQAQEIMRRLNDLSWNGRYYTHFVPLDPSFQAPGVRMDKQLSLSNAYALNRSVLDQRQGERIVKTYFGRRDFDRAFAEWYSIDPPFPAGSFGLAGRPGENPGEYVNGGILPLTGGELARGAFRYGAEAYGFDILRRYANLIQLTGETYLWYYPDGRPGISGPDTIPTDGWGASAMLGALMEGAAGIEDRGSRYSTLRLSPRWAAADQARDVRAVARYAASDGYVAYTWRRGERSLRLAATGTWQRAYLRLLLPREASGDLRVTLNGSPVPAQIETVAEHSRYVVAEIGGEYVELTVEW